MLTLIVETKKDKTVSKYLNIAVINIPVIRMISYLENKSLLYDYLFSHKFCFSSQSTTYSSALPDFLSTVVKTVDLFYVFKVAVDAVCDIDKNKIFLKNFFIIRDSC